MVKFRRKVGVVLDKGLPVASFGLGITNLALNQKRIKQDREFHESQTKATEKLAESLDQVIDNTKVTKAARKYGRSTKKPYTEYMIGDAGRTATTIFRRKDRKKS